MGKQKCLKHATNILERQQIILNELIHHIILYKYSHKNLYKIIHSSFIYDSQNWIQFRCLEQISFFKIEVNSYNGVLLSNEWILGMQQCG